MLENSARLGGNYKSRYAENFQRKISRLKQDTEIHNYLPVCYNVKAATLHFPRVQSVESLMSTLNHFYWRADHLIWIITRIATHYTHHSMQIIVRITTHYAIHFNQTIASMFTHYTYYLIRLMLYTTQILLSGLYQNFTHYTYYLIRIRTSIASHYTDNLIWNMTSIAKHYTDHSIWIITSLYILHILSYMDQNKYDLTLHR